MSANAFDTLKAAKSLEAAGFDETQAEAVVATVGDAVRAHTEPLASGIAAIADTMATKEAVTTVEDKLSAVNDDVATVKDNVATLTVRVETLSGNMATKDIVANMATKDSLAALAARVETISRTMATKEYVDAAIAGLRAEIAVDFRNLYRHLWVMGTGYVAVTVALIKLLP